MPTLKGILEALFWMVMAVACILAAMVLIGWGAMPMLSYGGAFAMLLMFPLVLRVANVIRRRRGAAVLTYVEQAVRLNLPLPRMIDATRRSETGYLADRLGSLTRQLESGAMLSTALRVATPELGAAPPAMIEAAEHLGRLPHVLRRLVEQNSQKSAADSSDAIFIRAYPFVMTIMMAIAISFFAIFVMPKYEAIFHDFGMKLPAITMMVMRTPEMLGPIVLAVALISMLFWTGTSFARIVRPTSADGPSLHRLRDRLIWWTPLLHGLARDRGLADALDLIAEALRAGQPIDRAAHEASTLRVNTVLRARLATWSKRLEAGDAIGDAARSARLPQLLVEMLSTARSGDQAADVLDFLSRYYESRFSRLRVFIQAAGVPVMVLCFAILVAVIAVGMFLPMIALINSLSSGSMTHWRL